MNLQCSYFVNLYNYFRKIHLRRDDIRLTERYFRLF